MSNCQCEHPEFRPEKGECSAEQIEKCHGDEKKHPCNDKQEKK
jgi:hypothetical protein